MMRKYIVARQELLKVRDQATDEAKRTRYASNANYIYEPFRNDTPAIALLRSKGEF